jgi:hypothetical protein
LDQGDILVAKLPSLFRGEDSRCIGYKRALLWLHCGDDVEESSVRVAFNVQFKPGSPRSHEVCQLQHIGVANVPLVRSVDAR